MKVLHKINSSNNYFCNNSFSSLLFWFLNRTKTGKSMKAYSDNEDLALLSGIDPKKIV